jgi:hypothetical protein
MCSSGVVVNYNTGTFASVFCYPKAGSSEYPFETNTYAPIFCAGAPANHPADHVAGLFCAGAEHFSAVPDVLETDLLAFRVE